MTSVRLTTRRLDLVLQTPEAVLAWIDTLPAAVRAEVSPAWVDRVRSTAPGDPWSLSFQIYDRATGAVVGSCGFKGPPDGDGAVEIAYGIEAKCQSRGYATESATALVEFAESSGLVRHIRALTRPDNVASIKVLCKCGFTNRGDVLDPEDGLVTRWERP